MTDRSTFQDLKNLLEMAQTITFDITENLESAKLGPIEALSNEARAANYRALSQVFDDFVRLRPITQQIRDSINREVPPETIEQGT